MQKPYGVKQLKSHIELTEHTVECPVAECSRTVDRQKRTFRREVGFKCPVHDIYISPSTHEYEDESDNMLWTSDEDMSLWGKIKQPGIKRESRVSRENSEDAVTWNVFRFLERQHLLSAFVDFATQSAASEKPHLIYWSYCQRTGKAWKPLLDAAEEFGEIVAQRSEPDLIIEDDNDILFIEAKFSSGNKTTPSNPSDPKRYLTGGNSWFADMFAEKTGFLDVAVNDKLYELMRLWLIGSWIADRQNKTFHLVNLVRATEETDITSRFGTHIRSDEGNRFSRVTWEDIFRHIVQPSAVCDEKSRFVEYFENKSMGYDRSGSLRNAFTV